MRFGFGLNHLRRILVTTTRVLPPLHFAWYQHHFLVPFSVAGLLTKWAGLLYVFYHPPYPFVRVWLLDGQGWPRICHRRGLGSLFNNGVCAVFVARGRCCRQGAVAAVSIQFGIGFLLPCLRCTPMLVEKTASWPIAWGSLSPGSLVAICAMVLLRKNEDAKAAAAILGRRSV